MTSIAQAQREFSPSGLYLNTATVGLPPRRTVDAVQGAVQRWAGGEDNGPDFDPAIVSARASYAELVGVPDSWVAIGSQSSVMAGAVAAGLPDGAEVLLAEGDFTSVMFPFLAQQKRGVRVLEAPVDALPQAISASTTLVAVSSVQSADGTVADLEAIRRAAAAHGARVLVDLTQSAGWLDVDASGFDYTICSAYKWLMGPRGGGFFTIRPELVDDVSAHNANWFGGAEVWSSIYGSPLRLADTARQHDVSPSWFSWIGLEQSLELIREVGVQAIGEHSVGLANQFRAAAGLASGQSAIVSVPVRDGAADAISAAGLRAAMRAGSLRLAFYLYNTEDDVVRAIETLRPYL